MGFLAWPARPAPVLLGCTGGGMAQLAGFLLCLLGPAAAAPLPGDLLDMHIPRATQDQLNQILWVQSPESVGVASLAGDSNGWYRLGNTGTLTNSSVLGSHVPGFDFQFSHLCDSGHVTAQNQSKLWFFCFYFFISKIAIATL